MERDFPYFDHDHLFIHPLTGQGTFLCRTEPSINRMERYPPVHEARRDARGN